MSGSPSAWTRLRKRAMESGLVPSLCRVSGSAASSDSSGSVRREKLTAPKVKSLSLTIGPPAPRLIWFWVYFWPNAGLESSTNSRVGSRKE